MSIASSCTEVHPGLVGGVVILEFPTFDEPKVWYDSPAYREVREHRYKGADYRAVIVEGSDAKRPSIGR